MTCRPHRRLKAKVCGGCCFCEIPWMDEVTCCFFHIWIEETVHGNQICLVVMSWFSSAISNMFLLKMFVVLFKKTIGEIPRKSFCLHETFFGTNPTSAWCSHAGEGSRECFLICLATCAENHKRDFNSFWCQLSTSRQWMFAGLSPFWS